MALVMQVTTSGAISAILLQGFPRCGGPVAVLSTTSIAAMAATAVPSAATTTLVVVTVAATTAAILPGSAG
jgi:hypothetical protein